MFSQIKLLVIVITIFLLNEIHGGLPDEFHVSESSMVRHSVNSMDVATKINPTLPSIPLQSKQQSNSHLITQNIPEATKIKRQGKIFSDISFLTGLGIGTLAASSSSAVSAGLPHHSVITTSMDSTHPIVRTTDQQFPLSLTASDNFPNVYDRSNLHLISLSNHNLLNQAIKSMQEILEHIKAQNTSKQMSNIEPLTSISSSLSSTMLKQPTFINTESPTELNQLNQHDDTSEVRIFKKSDGQMGIFNCSALKEIIRETIRENNVFNDQRQANPMDTVNQTSTETADAANKPIPPVAMTSEAPATTSELHHSNTTKPSGYYGGHPQNLSGINFISGSYPLTSYGYPNPIQNIYGPPIYPAESFHHHHHQQQQQQQQPQEYYHPEIIEEYPQNTLINSGNHFSSVSDPWPIYPPYARARKLLKADNDKLIIGGSGFIPTNKIG